VSGKYSAIDFGFDGLTQAARDLGLVPIFERIRVALRSTRDSLDEVEGTMKVIRYNVPPVGAPAPVVLPLAGAKYHGQVLVLDKAGVALDTVHICLQTAVPGVYAWKQFTVF